MQPRPNKAANIKTKLSFISHTNNYAQSEARAPLAVIVVRDELDRNQTQTVIGWEISKEMPVQKVVLVIQYCTNTPAWHGVKGH